MKIVCPKCNHQNDISPVDVGGIVVCHSCANIIMVPSEFKKTIENNGNKVEVKVELIKSTNYRVNRKYWFDPLMTFMTFVYTFFLIIFLCLLFSGVFAFSGWFPSEAEGKVEKTELMRGGRLITFDNGSSYLYPLSNLPKIGQEFVKVKDSFRYLADGKNLTNKVEMMNVTSLSFFGMKNSEEKCTVTLVLMIVFIWGYYALYGRTPMETTLTILNNAIDGLYLSTEEKKKLPPVTFSIVTQKTHLLLPIALLIYYIIYSHMMDRWL